MVAMAMVGTLVLGNQREQPRVWSGKGALTVTVGRSTSRCSSPSPGKKRNCPQRGPRKRGPLQEGAWNQSFGEAGVLGVPKPGQEHPGLRRGCLHPGNCLCWLPHAESAPRSWASGWAWASPRLSGTCSPQQAQSPRHLCLRPGGSVQHLVQLVLLAEVAGEGEAGEVLNPGPVDGVDVEPEDQGGKEASEDQQ